MRKSTLIVLVVLVTGLGLLWRAKQQETARGGPTLSEYPLLPALSIERVSAVRIEHLERGFQLKLERDAAGRWFLTDPVSYPALGDLVRHLLQTLELARAEPAPEADLAQVRLDPPLVVLECVQADDSGPRTLRLELGTVDVDSALVYARVPGHPAASAEGGCEVFRTTRALTNTLERNPDDYRDHRGTNLQPQDVVAFRRRGLVFLQEEGHPVDLAFDALRGPDGWKRAGPIVTLDPNGVGLLLRGATGLTIERFADDSPTDLTRWGLAEPLFTLELQTLAGNPTVLRFGHPRASADADVGEFTWYCQREGYAHVWEVRTRDVQLLTRPADLFYDQSVVRALRTDVLRLELEAGGARRILEREGTGWTVYEAGSTDEGHYPGSAATIEEALAVLERAQLAEHLPEETFQALDPPASFHLELANGTRFGGRLGAPARDPESGAQGAQYLRDGDEVLAVIGDEVLELCARPLDDFRSRKLHRIVESQVRMIELEAHGKTYAFVNTGDNVWNVKGQSFEAPDDFVQSLDGLLNLGAERWLDAPPKDSEPLLAVNVVPLQGDPYRFRFEREGSGSVVCFGRNGQMAEVDGTVVERLLRLF